MSKIKIIALTEPAKPIIKSSYNGIRFNPILRAAYKAGGVKVEYENDTLIFNSKTGIKEENLVQVEGFFITHRLKKNVDYKIEVEK